jgi:hypothetical protein
MISPFVRVLYYTYIADAYVGDLHNLGTNKTTLYQEKNITDKVIDALGSPDVLNKIILSGWQSISAVWI